MSGINLHDLPDDVLHIIRSHFDLADWMNVGESSRALHAIFMRMVNSIRIPHEFPADELLPVLEGYSSLTSIYLPVLNFATLTVIKSICRLLTRLSIRDFDEEHAPKKRGAASAVALDTCRRSSVAVRCPCGFTPR